MSKKCPFCGEEIADSAKKCRFCGEWLDQGCAPVPAPNVSNPQPYPNQPHPQVSPQPVTTTVLPDCPETPDEETVLDNETENKGFFALYFKQPYFRQFKDFSSRTSRKEFWMAWLAMQIINVGLGGLAMLLWGLGGMTGLVAGSAILALSALLFTVPSLALTVRRLRDAGKSPYMIFIVLVPVVGSIILLVFLCMPSVEPADDTKASFTVPDWIITGVCAVSLGLGIYFSTTAMTGMAGDLYSIDEYDLDETVDDTSDSYDVIAVEDANAERPSGDNLLDLCYDTEYILSGMNNSVNAIRFGSDQAYYNTSGEWGSTSTPLRAEGYISSHSVNVICYITEDGELHGRYHNENGINLDFNGYLDSAGDLIVQLGHGSEKSDWILHYVENGTEIPGAMRYEGTWGRNNKESALTFTIDGD